MFWSLIAVALAMSVARIFLADIDDYQAELEQKIRQISGIPLRIGTLDAGLRGFNPEVILKDIRIEAEDPAAKPDIQLREIRLGIDFLDLLLRRDWLSASRVTLVGANISIIRQEDGSFVLKGLQASDEPPLWLLRGGKYEILDSEITWLDLKRHGKPVHFDRFDLVLKNHYFDQSHEVHLLSKLPEQYGDSLRISANITGNIFLPDDFAGEIYLEGTDLQSTALVTGDLPLGFNLQAGAGDIRVWSLWRNASPYQVDGYVQAQQVKVSKNQGKPLALDTFEASFSWSDIGGRWRLAGYDVNIYANRQRWPDGAFYLQQDGRDNLSAVIKQLDLPAAMYLAPLLIPTDHDHADYLALNPKGRLHDVSLFVSSDYQQYAARGSFSDLGVEHFGAIPQIKRISGEISLTDRYGQIILNTHDGEFHAADWFRNPLAVKRLQGTVHWWQTAEAWQFFSRDLAVDSADFAGVAQLDLWLPKSAASPVLDLTLAFGQFDDISQAPKYLPAKIMGEGAVEWLDDAFIGGHIKRGELVVKGALDQFPFVDGSGLFETVFTIEDGEIQFNQDWPHLRDVHADVQFSAADLQVAILKGHSEKVAIDQAVVTIPDLANSEHVYVWGRVESKIMDSLAFLQKSPLKTKVDPIAGLIRGTGTAKVGLDLKIPYSESEPVKVKVDAQLDGAQLTVLPVNLNLDAIKGVLTFTEDRIYSTRLDARGLGYPIQGRLTSDAHATYLDLDGVTSIDKLVAQFGFLKNDIAKGKFAYAGKLTLPYAAELPASLRISSSLKGVGVDSPMGLNKAADEALALNLNFEFADGPELPLELSYGEGLTAYLLIDKNREALQSAHVVFGRGRADRYDGPGLKLDIRQAEFDMSRAVGAVGIDSRLPALKEVSIDTGQLVWRDQKLGPLSVSMLAANRHWQGNLDSAMARGRFSIPEQLGGSDRIVLDMDFLNLSAMDKFNLAGADEAVTELPLIDINSRHLLWRGSDLGALALQTERVANGIHFKAIELQSDKSKINLTADWLKQPTGTITQVKGNLKADKFGDLLSRLAFSDDFKETTADIRFKGGWRGGPHQFSLGRLNGLLQLDLKDGRISSIEPGFGRLLGLIAMEQWVKRLSLDFSDVYRQGLAFDQIKGRIKIRDGLAYTDDLTVDAVAANFYLAGYANLADKTLDQRVAVVPKSSGALPIAGTIVGGIASIITQVVTDDYKEGYFFGSQYKLSGNWGDIDVTPLHDEDGLVNKTWRGLTDFGWLDSITE
nr:YhdP family protein [Methylomonas sp. SURF-2]